MPSFLPALKTRRRGHILLLTLFALTLMLIFSLGLTTLAQLNMRSVYGTRNYVDALDLATRSLAKTLAVYVLSYDVTGRNSPECNLNLPWNHPIRDAVGNTDRSWMGTVAPAYSSLLANSSMPNFRPSFQYRVTAPSGYVGTQESIDLDDACWRVEVTGTAAVAPGRSKSVTWSAEVYPLRAQKQKNGPHLRWQYRIE